MSSYNIYMFILEECIKYNHNHLENEYKDVNIFFQDYRESLFETYTHLLIVDTVTVQNVFFHLDSTNTKININKNKIHYDYYPLFHISTILEIQKKWEDSYIPAFRLILCNDEYSNYGVHRYGWKYVIHHFLSQSYIEHDPFYYENPSFEWVSFAMKYNLNTFEETLDFFQNHKSIENMDFDKKMKYIIFDDWLEKKYLWTKNKNIVQYIYPYLSFIHDPPCYTTHYETLKLKNKKNNKQFLEENVKFLQYKSNLNILITLSNYHRNYILSNVNMDKNTRIETLYHPLEIDIESQKYRFDLDSFLQNQEKTLYCIGWWLRKYKHFCNIPYKKKIVVKSNEGPHVCEYVYRELRSIIYNTRDYLLLPRDVECLVNELNPIEIEMMQEKYQIEIVNYLENHEYDQIFKSNIIFLDTYDAVCNNVVLECIMHYTPLLVYPNPSTVEYLGENYPFYFTNAVDAETKLNNTDIIKKTHEYLKEMDKTKFTYAFFNKQLHQIILTELSSK